MDANFETSAPFMGFTMTLWALWWLGAAVICSVLHILRSWPYVYGMGDDYKGYRTKEGKIAIGEKPVHGEAAFWYHHLKKPAGMIPPWAWAFCWTLSCVAAGLGAGFAFWIADSTNNIWLTIMSFFLIIPALAGLWAIVFFVACSLGGSLFVAVINFAAAGVQFGMTLAYPLVWPASNTGTPTFWQDQWLAFGLSILYMVWTLYVMVINVLLYTRNHDMDDEENEASEVLKAAYSMAVDHGIQARQQSAKNFAAAHKAAKSLSASVRV